MLLSPDQTRKLYRHAVENRYAILAVNADSPAAIRDCLIAAERRDAPIIIETSLWQLTGHSFGAGDPFLGVDLYLEILESLADTEPFRNVPVVYHTDHIKGDETLRILRHAMIGGASSISLDSSELTDQQNIFYLISLCGFAEANHLGATLEMEAGVDDGVTPTEVTRELFGAVEGEYPGYLALWAPGVGTKHGLGGDMEGFSIEAIAEHREIASRIANRPIGIALHGSSGLSNEQLTDAVGAGVAKVNWSSESLLIRSHAARDYYVSRGEALEKGHPDFKATAMDHGLQSHVSSCYVPRVEERIRTLNGSGFGSAFMASIGEKD